MGSDPLALRDEAISYAAFGLLKWRFANSEGAATVIPDFALRLASLGYDPQFTSTSGPSPAALGNRIAQAYIQFGLSDGSNETGDYTNQFYEPLNAPFFPELGGNPTLTDPEPLATYLVRGRLRRPVEHPYRRNHARVPEPRVGGRSKRSH